MRSQIILFLLLPTVLFAQLQDQKNNQNRFKNIAFNIDYHQGKILKIYPEFPEVTKSSYYSLNVVWQTDGSKEWHHHYNFPESGFNIIYSDLGNDSILGRSIGLFPNLNLKIRNQKRWGFFFKLGSGFSWFNKHYDRLKNPENNVIGSHITNITFMGFNAYLQLTQNLRIHGGYTIIHFSNAHVIVPNVGSNDFPWNIGLQFKPFKTTIQRDYQKDESAKPFVFNMKLGLGFHTLGGTVSPNGGPTYPIYAIAPFVSKRIGQAGAVHLGLYALYYTSFRDQIRREGYFIGNQFKSSCVVSVSLGYEWLIGHVGYLLEPVINLYNPLFKKTQIDDDEQHKKSTVTKHWLGARTGFAYYLLDKAKYPRYNPAIGMYIKTNKEQADYVEMNISCGF